MKILILGGTKFIGPHVVNFLHQAGHEITLFHRGETQHSFSFPVSTIKGNRSNLLDYKDMLTVLSPDIVIDMIAYSENDAQQLVEIFRGKVKRIIIVSSCDVYRAYDRLWKAFDNELVSMPLNEKSELRENLYPYRNLKNYQTTDWEYHYEKILVENAILACPDICSTILRLPMVYGPGEHTRIYPYLKRMDDGRDILLDENKAQWKFTRGYVEDIAHAIALSALDESSDNKIYNIGESNTLNEKEWIQFIGKVADWKGKIITVNQEALPPHLSEPLLDWSQDMILDSHLIRREMNYKELYSPEDAMKKSIQWLRENKINLPTHYEEEDKVINRQHCIRMV